MNAQLRLSTVLEQCLSSYRQHHAINPRQWQICHHILACRTELLGETIFACDQCGHEELIPRACRDRHCPRCQRMASLDWCARQTANILPVRYHHVVFTLPHTINGLAQLHPEVVYDQLLKSTGATRSTFGSDPKRLNGQLGAILFLHLCTWMYGIRAMQEQLPTWGQTLVRHLHVHCLVPGGALAVDGTWNAAPDTYLFPVRALSRYFRGHFVRSLRSRFEAGELTRLTDPRSLKKLLDTLMSQEWAVYSKPCLQRLETIVTELRGYNPHVQHVRH